MEEVRAHIAGCSVCGAMFAEALAGLKWLRGLESVEPPVGLVNRILGATSQAELAAAETGDAGKAAAGVTLAARRPSQKGRIGQWIQPFFAPLLQPRMAATFAMAFFSIALLLNLAGVHIKNFRFSDLRPST